MQKNELFLKLSMFSSSCLLCMKFQNLRPCLRRFYIPEAIRKYKHSCTNLNELGSKDVGRLFNYFDSTGVLWHQDQPIQGSVETFNYFGDCGMNMFIVTNSSTRTRKSLHQKSCSMGIHVAEDAIVCTTYATAKFLKDCNFTKRTYIIGSQAVTRQFEDFGIKHLWQELDTMKGSLKDLRENAPLANDIGAVVVAFDEHFSYPKIAKACAYLQDPDCIFIVTHRDEQILTPRITLPSTGCFAAAIEAGSERKALLIGKPNENYARHLLEKGSIRPETTLMIGDRGSTDMAFGCNCGFYTLLVGTGKNSLADVRKWQESSDCEVRKFIPDFYLPKLGDLLKILK